MQPNGQAGQCHPTYPAPVNSQACLPRICGAVSCAEISITFTFGAMVSSSICVNHLKMCGNGGIQASMSTDISVLNSDIRNSRLLWNHVSRGSADGSMSIQTGLQVNTLGPEETELP